jgi:hypothetical protein
MSLEGGFCMVMEIMFDKWSMISRNRMKIENKWMIKGCR